MILARGYELYILCRYLIAIAGYGNHGSTTHVETLAYTLSNESLERLA